MLGSAGKKAQNGCHRERLLQNELQLLSLRHGSHILPGAPARGHACAFSRCQLLCLPLMITAVTFLQATPHPPTPPHLYSHTTRTQTTPPFTSSSRLLRVLSPPSSFALNNERVEQQSFSSISITSSQHPSPSVLSSRCPACAVSRTGWCCAVLSWEKSMTAEWE